MLRDVMFPAEQRFYTTAQHNKPQRGISRPYKIYVIFVLISNSTILKQMFN